MNDRAALRKGWAAYLAFYAAVFLVSLYPYLRYTERLGLVPLLSSAVDMLAMLCLYRHVRYRPLPTLSLRLLAIALAVIFTVRLVFLGSLLVPNLWPWSGNAEQWVSVVGLSAASVQIPMAVVLFLYALGTQRGRRTGVVAA